MKPYYEHAGITIYHGDCREFLPQLEGEGIQCVVTSPPYWGLRDYGNERQMGLERTPAEYVSGMTQVFAAVRQVLLEDGTLWLNMGDCYATGAGMVGECPGGGEQGDRWKGYRGTRRDGKHAYISDAMGPMVQPNRMPIPGLKPKDLVGIPWRIAFGIQAEGWYLRSDIIWSKPNVMPESVADRPTKSHEYLFLLAKSERYHCRMELIAEPAVTAGDDRAKRTDNTQMNGRNGDDSRKRTGRPTQELRNKRTVWTVQTNPSTNGHYATFPPQLIKPCVLAGCEPDGIVLDPFAGAGTTLLVAKQNGCRSIGIEIEEKYCEIAAKRLSQEVFQFKETKGEQNYEQAILAPHTGPPATSGETLRPEQADRSERP